jgi:hypothetical protein
MSRRERGKICTHCRNLRGWDEYADHKRTRDGKQSWCRYCKNDGMKALREERRSEQ